MIALCLAALLAQSPEPVRFGGFLAEIDGLEEPSSVAVGANDEIYVVERFARRIRVFDAGGKELRSFDNHGASPGPLLEPAGIAVSDAGIVYVSDLRAGGRLTRLGTDGRMLAPMVVGWRGPGPPLGLDVDGDRLLVAAPRGRELVLLREEERADAAERSELGARTALRRPVDVAFGVDGALYVADAVRHQVIELDPRGEEVRAIGDFGPYSGQFASPSGLDCAGGRLYVADRDNHRIQVFDAADAKLLYEWGIHALRPHEGQGRLHYPNDVAIAPSGQFAVVCEGFENRVQVFGPETDESVTQARSQERNTASHFGFGIAAGARVGAIVEPSAPGVLVYDLTQEEPIEISRFGRFGDKPGTFLVTSDVELARDGEQLFVADAERRRIDLWSVARKPDEPLRYDPMLARLVQSYDLAPQAGSSVRPDAPAVEPVAIEQDRAGHLWVVDAAGPGILCLDLVITDGRTVGFAPRAPRRMRLSGLLLPTDLALDREGLLLYVVDAGEQRVAAWRLDGLGSDQDHPPDFTFGGRGTGAGEVVRPTGITAGQDGFVYVTDEGGHRIAKFDEQGKFVAAFGKQGLGRVEFYKPRGIRQAPDGKLYVVDYGNHRGQVLTPEGEFVVAFGARLFTQPTRTAK